MISYGIHFTPSPAPPADVAADWLIVGIAKNGNPDPLVADLELRLDGRIATLRELGDVTGKQMELVTLLNPTGIRAQRLVLVGLGPESQITRSTVHDAFAAALRSITGRSSARVALVVPFMPDPFAAALGAGVGAVQGSFGPGVCDDIAGAVLPRRVRASPVLRPGRPR